MRGGGGWGVGGHACSSAEAWAKDKGLWAVSHSLREGPRGDGVGGVGGQGRMYFRGGGQEPGDQGLHTREWMARGQQGHRVLGQVFLEGGASAHFCFLNLFPGTHPQYCHPEGGGPHRWAGPAFNNPK